MSPCMRVCLVRRGGSPPLVPLSPSVFGRFLVEPPGEYNISFNPFLGLHSFEYYSASGLLRFPFLSRVVLFLFVFPSPGSNPSPHLKSYWGGPPPPPNFFFESICSCRPLPVFFQQCFTPRPFFYRGLIETEPSHPPAPTLSFSPELFTPPSLPHPYFHDYRSSY